MTHGPGHASDSWAIFLYNEVMPDLNYLMSLIQKSQRTLFILCGFPYSGKSYVARQVLEHADAVFVSIDDIFHARCFDWNTDTLPNNDEWQNIFDESYEMSKSVLQEGKNVLYDSTNQTRASRDTLREVARSVGSEAMVIYIQCSPETVWRRWEENQKNPNRSVVSKNLVQMTIDQFEVPTEDESLFIINNESGL